MEFKGTQGRWNLGGLTEDGTLISANNPENRDIATVWKYDKNFLEKQEMEANAKLIACAPEMLEVLNLLANTAHLNNDLSDKVNSIIKKATE